MVRAILWASPLPPVRSGVSDYAVELLSELYQRLEVRVVAPPGWSAPADLDGEHLAHIVDAGTTPLDGEISLIHLGNNPHHEWLLGRLASPRCVVVLHDLVLHHLLVESTLVHRQEGAYARALEAEYGATGVALAQARSLGMTGRLDPFLFPARASFINAVQGVVVHSEWARLEVERTSPCPVATIGMPVADPGSIDRGALRRRLGIDDETLLVMNLGFLTGEKGLREILEAVAAAARAGIKIHLVAVGEGEALPALSGIRDNLGLHSVVSSTGWVSAGELRQLPGAADLGLVLRTPSAGETSAAAVRFLAAGTPVAVMGRRQFLEWPEGACPRITPGVSASAELLRLFKQVTQQRQDGTWSRRREAARKVYEERHRPGIVARALVDFLEGL